MGEAQPDLMPVRNRFSPSSQRFHVVFLLLALFIAAHLFNLGGLGNWWKGMMGV
jgi:hypothetical protein